jgi:hypothetical protein
MRPLLATLGFVTIIGAMAVRRLPAKESEHRQPIAWCYVREGPLELVRKTVGRRTGSLSLSRGMLAPVLKTESKAGRMRAMLRLTDLETLNPVEGWVDSSQAEIIPFERFPSDAEVMRQVSIEPPNGSTGRSGGVARWLVKQGDSGPALLCFAAAFGQPISRLIAFLPEEGKYVHGAWLEFPFSDMKPGIVYGEVRDLLRDGHECLITHEPFREGPATFGMNIVIRRLERGKFSLLWKAPLEWQNLGFFPSEMQIFQPPERNAGAPGTVTKGEVEFQPHGKTYMAVWKATVEFFGPGQDKPIESVKVTKACPWIGNQFEPVR